MSSKNKDNVTTPATDMPRPTWAPDRPAGNVSLSATPLTATVAGFVTTIA